MKRETKLLVIILCSLVVLILCPFLGSMGATLDLSDPTKYHIWSSIRVPRVLFGFIVGGGLALGGLVFQALFANLLASPFTLGVASGAAFGTALYYNLALPVAFLGVSAACVSGMAGALLATLPVFFASRFIKRPGSTEILLSGVVLSLFFSSLIVFIQCISDFTGVVKITRWLMGSFEVVGYSSVKGVAAIVSLALAFVFLRFRELDLFILGEELALSRGLDVKRTRSTLFLVTSLMVGGIVSFCGPVSSVGVISPHIARFLVGVNHKLLIPAAFFMGGGFVVLCDTVGRTIIAPYEIPVGVITALIEGPFFLWLLYGRRGLKVFSV